MIHRIQVPRHLVLAFMAGLSRAAGFSAECYVAELVMSIGLGARSGAA